METHISEIAKKLGEIDHHLTTMFVVLLFGIVFFGVIYSDMAGNLKKFRQEHWDDKARLHAAIAALADDLRKAEFARKMAEAQTLAQAIAVDNLQEALGDRQAAALDLKRKQFKAIFDELIATCAHSSGAANKGSPAHLAATEDFHRVGRALQAIDAELHRKTAKTPADNDFINVVKALQATYTERLN